LLQLTVGSNLEVSVMERGNERPTPPYYARNLSSSLHTTLEYDGGITRPQCEPSACYSCRFYRCCGIAHLQTTDRTLQLKHTGATPLLCSRTTQQPWQLLLIVRAPSALAASVC